MGKKTKTTAAKVTKAKKSTKLSKVKAKAKSKAPVVVAAPVAAAPATPAPPSLTEDFSQLLAHLTALRSQLTAVTAQVRTLQKRSERELKNALKASKKRQRKAGNRAPSGFVKPTKISKELASFLGKPHGTEMARTQVTREINAYIRAHNLQDPKNGRVIRADTKLRKLLKLTKEDELTYFNLQRYMSPHFAKSAKAKAAAAAAAAAS
ncbi:MAG: SWIB/MDM2 domain-containing protein [Candidatus Neomarinimicrobiota bacterium]